MTAPAPPLCSLLSAALLLVALTLSLVSANNHARHQHQYNADTPEASHPVQVLVRPAASRVRIKCAVRSSKLVWTKDGVTLGCAAGGCRATLRLNNVTEYDAGMYQCWRPGGRLVPPSIRLKITEEQHRERPRLIGPWPRNLSMEAGSTVPLRCRIHSKILPNVQWLRRIEYVPPSRQQVLSSSPGNTFTTTALMSPRQTIQYEGDTYEVLSSNGELAFVNQSYYLSKLLLVHTTEQDSGFYVCLATNNHGFRFRGTHLTILSREQAGVLVPAGQLQVEVALILLAVLLVASPVLALSYLAYSHHQALMARKHSTAASQTQT